MLLFIRDESMKTVITYGTFDIFHVGHLRMLERLSRLGDRLVVGVSTDEFNKQKGKESLLSYEDRAAVVSAIRCVHQVFPEESWDQKKQDIIKYNVNIFGIGDDWVGEFDYLKNLCEVHYLPRTYGISSTKVKNILSKQSLTHIKQIEESAREIASIMKTFGVIDDES